MLLLRVQRKQDCQQSMTEFPTIATHLVTFLAGIAAGAGGKYFADKFTDERHEKEAGRAERKQFADLESLMPDLFKEMREDIGGDATKLVREFVVLPSEGVVFNSSKKRFAYFERHHPELLHKLEKLHEAGFIRDVSVGTAPIYRWEDSFVSLLLADA
jgi:hypothetical protein